MSYEELIRENAALRTAIERLENQLAFLSRHQTLARGIAGERLISKLTDGSLTLHNSPVDINLADGRTIEVKHSGFSQAHKGYDSTNRWQWQKVFGERNGKLFDFLLLIGEADPRHSDKYLDPSSPYVFFLVPFTDIEQLTTAGTRGAKGILLLTNPAGARGRAAPLYRDYAVTTEQIYALLGTSSRPFE